MGFAQVSGWAGHRGTTTQRGYGWRWQKLRLQILKRDGYLCTNCLERGRPTPATDVDHIKPKVKGGTDEPGNLTSLCKPCHDGKSARDKGHRLKPAIGRDGWPTG